MSIRTPLLQAAPPPPLLIAALATAPWLTSCASPGVDEHMAHSSTGARLGLVADVADPVAFARVQVVRDGVMAADRTISMAPFAFGDEQSQLYGDAYIALRPGLYHVRVSPLDQDMKEIPECLQAVEQNVEVTARNTIEIPMTLFCDHEGTGGLDVLVTTEHRPAIADLRLRPSKLIAPCDVAVLNVDATDLDGGDLTYEWAVEEAPSPYTLTPVGSVARFRPEGPGSYALSVRVTDPEGHQAGLSFPMHVSNNGTRGCRPLPSERTLDEVFAQVGGLAEAFAGLHYEPVGREPSVTRQLVVSVTDLAQESQVISAINAELPDIDTSNYRLQQVDFPFVDLQQVRLHAGRDVLSAPGVARIGVDERNNSVRIGIVDEAARGGVEAALMAHGVNPDMVHVEVTEPVFFANLQEEKFVRKGGIQIYTGLTSRVGTSFEYMPVYCTMGPLATLDGERGFLTPSHCTDTMGGFNQFQEPYRNLAEQPGPSGWVAEESVDPYFMKGLPCPSKRRCRYSDAAFFGFYDDVHGQRGAIANPRYGSQPTSELWYDYHATSEKMHSYSGEQLRKVGRSTGETFGEVIETCEDINVHEPYDNVDLCDDCYGYVGETDITFLCQTRVEADTRGGDSGAPVFQTAGGLNYDVALAGMLWGAAGSEDDTGLREEFVFSTMGQLRWYTELGPISVVEGNEAPEVTITKPQDGAAVSFSMLTPVEFRATSFDYEGSFAISYTWESDVAVDNANISGTGKQVEFLFTTPGWRNITVTASDGAGGTSSDTIGVAVVNGAPSVSILEPNGIEPLIAGLPHVFASWGQDPGTLAPLPCGGRTWTSSDPDDPFPWWAAVLRSHSPRRVSGPSR